MRFLLTFLALLLSLNIYAQSAYTPLNQDYYHLIDRYEILNGKINTSLFTGVKPFERKAIAQFLDSIEIDSSKLSKADKFNLNYLAIDNWEWTNTPESESKKPFLKYFYRKKSDLYSVHNEDFDLHVNPVIYFQMGKENDISDYRYLNTRGIELRGMINNKVGFYTFAADNQAMLPTYASRFVSDFNAVPGEGFYKPFKQGGVDFLTARGYFTFNIIKNIQFQFGHDKNFIGNGYRSLILSDFSNAYTFMKLNVKVWKLNYYNLFTQMNAEVQKADNVYPKKYLAFHHLSVNIGKHLNVGLFESVVFGREDSLKNGQFDINYLNPVIFYRSLEQQLGSGDNAILGMDYKLNFLKHFSFYGQIVLDEFLLKEIKARNGWWANKQALQVGLKYMNVAGIKNLDMQGEFNLIRPYTYAHKSKYTSYTHYNQPLAHPLGANLYEFVGITKYQPLKRLNLTGKLIYTKFGADSNATDISPTNNNGGNVLKDYTLVAGKNTYGNTIGQGIATNMLYLSLTASYQLKHNLFVDLIQVIRQSDSVWDVKDLNTSYTALGLRWNISPRVYEF